MDSPKENAQYKTSIETIIGWLSFFFSLLVMACGFKDGKANAVFWAGVAMISIGTIFIVIGKYKQRKSSDSSSNK